MPPKHSKPEPPPGTAAAKSQVPRKSLLSISALPVAILTLAAFTSPVSQATLAPVFGAIPASINHAEAIAATTLLGFLWRWQYKDARQEVVLGYLAAWYMWIPVISMKLFRYSEKLGIIYGPALIGFLSCHTVLITAGYVAAEALEELHLDDQLGATFAPLLLAMAGVFHLVSFEKFFQSVLPGLSTVTRAVTPVKMQAFMAATLAYTSHSRLALLGLPALIHVFSANTHFDSGRTLNTLNATLHKHDWSILARQWSNTGYISVLDNLQQDFRVMRADHSLLGGEWLATDLRIRNEGWAVNEPIYAVFNMLEAGRLVPTTPPIEDNSAQALFVGLGIGTSPKAFIAHGINTTIIELDPAVHQYAIDYFALPTNHTPIIQDAVSAVQFLGKGSSAQTYDHIIHDVFTGGAEPLALFTKEFLTDLHAVLKPNGIVAINYAGDVSSPLTQKVLRTIRATFGASCRAFRDSPPPPAEAEKKEESKGEVEDFVQSFANMVIFCRHLSRSEESVTFRRPAEADYLRRQTARQSLLPNPEYEVELPSVTLLGSADGKELLRKQDIGDWSEQQKQSAVRHWHIMRKVVPAIVWDLW